jgi:hypothetical protein
LLNNNAIKEINPVRPIAIGALLILCGSIAFFFFLISAFFSELKATARTIQVSGITSMVFASFILPNTTTN